MKINYEAHDVFDPDYLNENVGFIAGVLDLLKNQNDLAGGDKNNLLRVLNEASNRATDILEQIDEVVAEEIESIKAEKKAKAAKA
jgi:hypothetical protein